MTIPSGTERPGDDQTPVVSALAPAALTATSTTESPSAAEAVDDDSAPSLAQATERLIERFGGIRPMASKLEIPVTTVQGWKKRGAVPLNRLADLRVAAQRHEIQLDDADLTALGWNDALVASGTVAAAPDSKGGVLSTGLIPSVVIPRVVIPPATTSLEPPRVPSSVAGAISRAVSETASGAADAADQVTPAARELNRRPLTTSGKGTRPDQAVGDAWAKLSMAAAVVALLAAGVAVTAPLWLTPGDPQPLAPAALQNRLGDLEAKLSRATLDRSVVPAELEKRVDQLEASLARVSGDQTNTLGDLSGRLSSIEKGLPALTQKGGLLIASGPTVTVLLATAQLRTVLASANPFQAELAAAELSGPSDPPLRQALDQISSRSAIGIATTDWLAERFSGTARAVLRAVAADNPLVGVADQALGLLSTLAPPLYRLTTSFDNGSVRVTLDRTEAWLAAGDLPRAVEQLSLLSGSAAEAAAPWLAEAQARVAADRVRTLLGQRVIGLLPTATTR